MTDRSRQAASAAMALLLLVSSVVGAVALVGAQTDTYEKTITGSPQQAVVDLSGVSGTVEVEVEVPSPNSDGTIIVDREQIDTADAKDKHSFRNGGAYENVTLRVVGADAEPGFGDEDIWPWNAGGDQFLSTSGGDTDLNCNNGERLFQTVNPYVQVVDCQALPGEVTTTSDDIQSNQTGLDLYTNGQAINASNANHHDTMNGWLTDAREVALQRGYNAYVRALNNGSSQSAAETAATEAINQYYANHEQQVLNKWNIAVEQAWYDYEVDQQENTEAMVGLYSEVNGGDTMADRGIATYDMDSSYVYNGLVNTSYTLQDGSTTTVREWDYQTDSTYDSNYVSPLESSVQREIAYNHSGADYGFVYAAEPSKFMSHLDRIENESSNAVSQIQTVSDGVYQDYQQGEINNSDLVNPTMLSRQYSPGSEYQTWAAATLTSVGASGPENLSQVGHMNLTLDDGTNVSGLLMSDGNPSSGQFEKGQTYDPANIEGAQFIITNDRLREIKQPFTLRESVTASGESVDTVTIEERNYETTNVSQLKDLYNEIEMTRAALEARQNNLEAGAGGGFLGGGGSSTAVIVLVAAAGVAILAGRDSGR